MKGRRAGSATRDILVVSRYFPPAEGGIQEYIYQRCLQDPARVVLLAESVPGDLAFDRTQPFPIHRWRVPLWLGGNRSGSRLRYLVSLFCLSFAILRLHFRCRFRAVEWGHGYDFPVLLALSYLLPVRYILCLHGHDLLCSLRSPLQRKLFSLTLRRMRHVVCNSHFTRDYLLARLPVPVAASVIHPCVRAAKFGASAEEKNWRGLRRAVRNKLGIGESAMLVVSVGRLIPRKGFDQVVRLLPKLVCQRIDVHYAVCGQGDQMGELQSLARALAVEDRVHLLGLVLDNELGGYYAASDIFVMLTCYDARTASIEGYGIVYAEAGFFGKPVLAAAIGGVSEAVRHDENGLLVPPQSPGEAFEALHRLCLDEELRKRLGSLGRDMARRKMRFIPESPEDCE